MSWLDLVLVGVFVIVIAAGAALLWFGNQFFRELEKIKRESMERW